MWDSGVPIEYRLMDLSLVKRVWDMTGHRVHYKINLPRNLDEVSYKSK